jgi:hypothetical protein
VRREKKPWWKGTNLNGKHNPASAPRVLRPNGPTEGTAAYEARWAGFGELGWFLEKVSKWKLSLNFKRVWNLARL